MQDAGIVQITSDPEAYLRYLNCQADNPSYSAGNVALVMVQDQSATIFGTKDRWKSLMRSVSPTEEKNGVKIYTRSSFGKGLCTDGRLRRAADDRARPEAHRIAAGQQGNDGSTENAPELLCCAAGE